MKIGDFSNIANGSIINQSNKIQKKPTEDFLNTLISNVKEAQAESNELTGKFIKGEDVALHEVMIAGEKAKTSLQLLMEIRNKALDMYKELTKMGI
ncbi:MAG: flagellar hook-basal body complex protein FliE [Melioribacteraceae bacterium]|nr:flagellar hook-basal body complex protein FliE [Melioribacteraceae bacterium]